MQIRRRSFTALAGLVALAGCSSNDPTAQNSSSASGSGDSTSLVVGSQQYYSNEIIAELYAQVLENAGFTVERRYQIGQREVYMPQMQNGSIDIMPEYGGNLLQYYDSSASSMDADSVQQALSDALPDGLRALDYADATDQDSYTVTQATADQYGLVEIGDLSKIGETIQVAANTEFESRPYGPQGLKDIYDVDATVVSVEDSGGPLTVKALTDGTVNAADIYTASPSILTENLVVLEDPQNMILPEHVTPVVSQNVDDSAASAIQGVNEQLSSDDLIELNRQSTVDQRNSSDIAADWLSSKGLI